MAAAGGDDVPPTSGSSAWPSRSDRAVEPHLHAVSARFMRALLVCLWRVACVGAVSHVLSRARRYRRRVLRPYTVEEVSVRRRAVASPHVHFYLSGRNGDGRNGIVIVNS